jgi:hypothetical protein
MRHLVTIAIAAMFSITTTAAFAADTGSTSTTGTPKATHTKKVKKHAKKKPMAKKEKAAVTETHHEAHTHTPMPMPLKVEEPKHEYPAKFKGAYGKVEERRTYPTEEMKNKAVDLWDREGKILEPDGTITTPASMVKKTDVPGIPGH